MCANGSYWEGAVRGPLHGSILIPCNVGQHACARAGANTAFPGRRGQLRATGTEAAPSKMFSVRTEWQDLRVPRAQQRVCLTWEREPQPSGTLVPPWPQSS